MPATHLPASTTTRTGLARRASAGSHQAVVYDVFCGIDVARETHHVVALDPHGQRLIDRPLPNAEPELAELFTQLEAHGLVLVVVDQLASIGALAIAVARSMNIAVAYLPGLAMRRIADLYPGEIKTDARDAHGIADAARTLPHALRRVGPDEQTSVALSVPAHSASRPGCDRGRQWRGCPSRARARRW
jgi:hypothetical protein